MRHHLQLATLTLLVSAGCKTTPPPTPRSTPRSTLMDAQARTSITQQATAHPTFKVFLQKQDLPTILVVDEATTDGQLRSLVFYLRIETRDGHLKDLGIKPTAITFGTPSYNSGELAIYRGPRCAAEMYSQANPCGPSIHKAASYHWGDGGDQQADTASINSNILFTSGDHFQTAAEATADPTGSAHKASLARIHFATAQNANSSKRHSDLRFAIGSPDDQLRIVSYQLATDAGRATFLRQYLMLEQDHLCPLGFRTLQLGALGSPAKAQPIDCPRTEVTFTVK